MILELVFNNHTGSVVVIFLMTDKVFYNLRDIKRENKELEE